MGAAVNINFADFSDGARAARLGFMIKLEGWRRLWPWLAVIVLTSCALILTVALLLASFLGPNRSAGRVPQSIAAQTSRQVAIVVNGRQRLWETALDNPLEILQSAQVELGGGDRIWVNGALANAAALAEWTVPARHIEIRKAVKLTIVDSGQPFSLVTAAKTVGDALSEAGLKLHSADEAAPPRETFIEGEMTISVDRAKAAALHVDGVQIEVRTHAETVADVLAELDSPLFGLDYVNPPAETAVSEKMTIEIVRVTEEMAAQTETIPYQARYQPDESLSLDEEAVVQAGQNGRREIRSRIRYENGIEVSRAPAETIVVEAPVDQVVAYGTSLALKTVDTPAGPRQYWRKLRMYATSYHPAALGGDSITAIGATLKKGIVAADPDIIPYRTDLYVPRYGLGWMADTGGPRSSPYWIDLGYSDEDWVSWSGYVDVYLLTPAPTKINYRLPAWRPLRNRPDN